MGPYAQLITVLLLIHTVMTPILISSLFKSLFWAPVFSFVPTFAMFSVNFIGVELENPFGDDDNDLPLDHFQREMNTCLLMLLQDNADLIASINERRCVTDFPTLHERVHSHVG